TLTGLIAKGPGFDTSSLVSFGIQPNRNGYSLSEQSRLLQGIREDIQNSAITEASAVTRVPLLAGYIWANPVTIQDGRRFATDSDVQFNAVTPGFFAALGIKIVAGRDFSERDALPGQKAAIVNEAFVKRYLGGHNPLGVYVGLGSGTDVNPDIEIVGVVA